MVAMFHPNKKKLFAWLSGDEVPRVERHVDKCERCAHVMENLDESSEFQLADALKTVLAPPRDLSERVEKNLESRIETEFMDYISDAFIAGLDTSKILIMGDNDE